jgi:serine phosphatase RsbU (regulator of sigma subunit)
VLCRLDVVLAQLYVGQSGTCVYAQLSEEAGTWSALLANAGHLPPLLLTGEATDYLAGTPEALLGAGVRGSRTTVPVPLAPGATLLLYTDGLIERRGHSIDDGLTELRTAAAALDDLPPDQLCDRLLAQFAQAPSDDVCLLAVRIPDRSRRSDVDP